MTVDEIKSKYCVDAENAAAIKKVEQLYAGKIIELAKKINEADYDLKELKDLKRKEESYKKVIETATSDFKKIISTLSNKDEKTEAKNIFKRWCKASVKGI